MFWELRIGRIWLNWTCIPDLYTFFLVIIYCFSSFTTTSSAASRTAATLLFSGAYNSNAIMFSSSISNNIYIHILLHSSISFISTSFTNYQDYNSHGTNNEEYDDENACSFHCTTKFIHSTQTRINFWRKNIPLHYNFIVSIVLSLPTIARQWRRDPCFGILQHKYIKDEGILVKLCKFVACLICMLTFR